MTNTTETPPPKPTRLAPIVTPDAKFFWDAADQEQFVGQRCGDCKRYRFPPRPMCPNCFSVKQEVVALSGRGTVYTWVVPRHPMPFGFKESPIVATVELEEGYRLVSNLVGIGHEDVKPGMKVEVCFEPTMNHHKVPVFRPVGG